MIISLPVSGFPVPPPFAQSLGSSHYEVEKVANLPILAIRPTRINDLACPGFAQRNSVS
jgi:hypothetical protein